MAEIKLKKREEMDPAYCWDLSSLFGSDEEFEKTEQELAKKIEAFRAKQGTMKESAEALYDVLSGLDDISRVFSSLYVYASQKYHQDMGNQKYQGYAGKMDSMMAVLADASSFVEPEILELDEETVTEFEKAYEPLRLYDRILKENFRKKEHILSPEMEAVLAKAGEMASSPDQIFSAFSNADLRFQPVTDEEENQVPLSHGTFVGFLQSKDRRVRKEAFEKYYAEYEKHKNMLAATFGANLKQAAFFADVRKYPSALAASLDGGNIPVLVYDKLLEAIHAKMPAMYRYVALRKKLLGVDELVTCKDLTKRFGNHTALDHLNLSLDSGKIIGLLGPNGSGKTTLLKLLNGLLTPSEGEVLIAGNHPGIETKRIVSYLPDKMYLGSWMRVSDLLTYYSDFFEDFDMSRANAMLESLKISPKDRLKTMSKGTKEKVQLILTMSRRAKLYCLDEPIAGVDPAARDYILSTILNNYEPDASNLISTHLIS